MSPREGDEVILNTAAGLLFRLAAEHAKARAANVLGIDLSTFYRKLKRYDAV